MEDREHMLEKTIPQLLRWRMERGAEETALREKAFGRWKVYSWRDYYRKVRASALGLLASGLKRGERIALIGDNIPEMLFVAIGAQSIGAVSVGIYQTSLPSEIQGILGSLEVNMVFCDDQEQVDKVVGVRHELPGITRVIYEDPRGMRGYRADPWFMDIRELWEAGRTRHEEDPALYDALVAEGAPDDVCHLCLTSGTTGLPKGTMLTHRNYVNMGVRLTEVDPLAPSDEYLSFLPFAWVGEQMNSFGVAMATGVTINFPESVETFMADLKEIGPHFMFGAPRIYENIRSAIWLKVDESYALNRRLYHAFMKVGERAAECRMAGRRMPPLLAFFAWLGKVMMFRPLVNQMGLMRLRRAYTGGAALGPELFTFFQAIGVNLKQIYGQTEITGIAYVHRDGDVRPDTVGLPLPGTECRISEKGEILSRSPSVTPGYYKLPEKTEELLEEGWLRSGDAGHIDPSGHLVVIDRLSDVMHTAHGKMFSPMFLENRLKFSPHIKEAVIFGDGMPYVTALINIDPTITGKWAEDRGISHTTFMDLSAKAQVAELVREEIRKVNRAAEHEHYRIRRFALLYKLLDMDDGELTKTGKIRRNFVRKRYGELHDALYDPGISHKEVAASYRYQDGQESAVVTTIQFHTMEERAA